MAIRSSLNCFGILGNLLRIPAFFICELIGKSRYPAEFEIQQNTPEFCQLLFSQPSRKKLQEFELCGVERKRNFLVSWHHKAVFYAKLKD